MFLILFFSYLLWKRSVLKRAGDPKLISALFKNHSSLKSGIKFSLLLIAFAFGCIALTNPRQPDDILGDERKGIDIVIALDVSNSMSADDVQPNRLLKAKDFISKLIDELPDDRIALMLFAGNAYLQMPLTFDHGAAKLYIAAASPGSIPSQGTVISEALDKSRLAFEEDSERFKSLILITDGETHDEDVLQKAEQLAVRGVMINTIGIGSSEGSAIRDTATGLQKRDETGRPVLSKLNDGILKEIAGTAKGTYVHLKNSDDALAAIKNQYLGIEKKSLTDASLFTFQTFYGWLALPMLLILILEIFITDRKKSAL